MYKAFEMLHDEHSETMSLIHASRILIVYVKINIINATCVMLWSGDYYYNPYNANKTFTDTDDRQVTLKIGITGVLPTQILVWDKANLEGKVTVDDPMEAVKANVPDEGCRSWL